MQYPGTGLKVMCFSALLVCGLSFPHPFCKTKALRLHPVTYLILLFRIERVNVVSAIFTSLGDALRL